MKLYRTENYGISYDENIPENAAVIIIAMHGFAGDRKSGCISLLENAANKMGIGLIKFDWPAHGESEVNGDKLSVSNCLTDLCSMVNHIKKRFPLARLAAFSTSFGGYLTLLYNYYNRSVFEHIILRSPAIGMYNILIGKILDGAAKEELAKNKSFAFGFERLMQVRASFLDELKNNDIVKLYGDMPLDNISIIHGTKDDIVPFGDSKAFSDIHKCRLYPIDGADHRYKKPGELDRVIEAASDILSGMLQNT